MSIKIGDWIVINDWGYGTYKENIGCICQVKDIDGKRVIVSAENFIRQDEDENHRISPEGYRLATPEEIPFGENKEPNYEIF